MEIEEFEKEFDDALDGGVTIEMVGEVKIFPDSYGIGIDDLIHFYLKHDEIANCKLNDITKVY